jgi:hypothetical protein
MNRRTQVLSWAVGALALAGAVAYATIPDPKGVIHGCYDSNGRLRVIDTGRGQLCRSGETALDWSQIGPPGAAGAQGAVGPRGAPGPAGPPGPAGAVLAYAHVQADGTIDHDSGNVTVSKVFAGEYCIGVTGGTVHAAVVSLDAQRNVGGSAQAGVYAYSGCPSNAKQIHVITRPHGQDGGTPGADRAFYIIVT